MSLACLPFTVSLCLLYSCSRIDLGDLSLLFASTICLTYVSAQLCRSDVDTGLVGSTFMRLACKGLEIVAIGRIAQLLDVSVINL